LRPAWKRRRIVVERIVDTLHQPIDPRAIELQPLRRRGRWLIIGHDLDRGKSRAFYWEVMRHVCRPVDLHLGIYDPMEDSPQVLGSGGIFAPTRKSREKMAHVIREYRMLSKHRHDIWLNVGVFPWEESGDDSRFGSR